MNPVDAQYHDLLRSSERDLPDNIRLRLTSARKAALSSSRSSSSRYFSWLPFSGVALASLVAMVLVWPEIQLGNDPMLSNDPLISENLEMYQNLDFYYWLTQNDFSSQG